MSLRPGNGNNNGESAPYFNDVSTSVHLAADYDDVDEDDFISHLEGHYLNRGTEHIASVNDVNIIDHYGIQSELNNNITNESGLARNGYHNTNDNMTDYGSETSAPSTHCIDDIDETVPPPNTPIASGVIQNAIVSDRISAPLLTPDFSPIPLPDISTLPPLIPPFQLSNSATNQSHLNILPNPSNFPVVFRLNDSPQVNTNRIYYLLTIRNPVHTSQQPPTTYVRSTTYHNNIHNALNDSGNVAGTTNNSIYNSTSNIYAFGNGGSHNSNTTVSNFNLRGNDNDQNGSNVVQNGANK